MIKGRVNISHITEQQLKNIVFTEKNYVSAANGLWDELGVSKPKYCEDSAVVYQCFGKDCPNWAEDIRRSFDSIMQYSTVTVNKLTPGCFIPPHKDHFYKLREATKSLDTKGLITLRINIMLQDKKLGHVLDIEGQTLDQYQAGDYVYIFPGIIHTAANLGWEDRYTMQVSGLVKPDDIDAS